MTPFPVNDWFDRLFLEFIDTTRDKAHKFFDHYYDIQRVYLLAFFSSDIRADLSFFL